MVFEGYLSLSGKEIVNAARTAAYVRNLAPAMAPKDCYDCDGALTEAVGDGEYTTPQGDDAPWYDPSNPATAGFYGFYPLEFQGASDSTRTIDFVEQLGDGDVILDSRHTGRDIRVRGMMFAEDRCALDAGISWLDNALRTEDECFGSEATVFACCPTLLDPEADYSLPYEQPQATEVCRQNLAINPTMNETSTTGIATPVLRTNLLPSPGQQDGTFEHSGSTINAGSTTVGGQDFIAYRLGTFVSVGAGTVTFIHMTGAGVAAVPVSASTAYTISTWMNTDTSPFTGYRLEVYEYDAGGVQLSGPTPIGTAARDGGNWTRVSGTHTTSASTAFMRATAVWTGGQPVVGTRIRIGGGLFEESATLEPYFSGEASADPNLQGHWTGAEQDSVSEAAVFGVGYPTSDAPLRMDGVGDAGGASHARVRQAAIQCTGFSCNNAVAVMPDVDDASEDTYWNATTTGSLYFEPDRTYRVSADVTLLEDGGGGHSSARAITVITDTGGSAGIDFSSPSAPATAGTHRVSVTFTVASDVTVSWLRLYNGSADPGEPVYWDRVLVEDITDGLPASAAYFDGSTADDADYDYEWDGERDVSTSTAFCAPDMSQELAAWNTTSGTISQEGSSIVVDWEDDDPCMIAWMEITGMAPGEQYQLRTYLESMDYYVRIGPEAPTGCRRNLFPDPKNTDGWFSSDTTDADDLYITTEDGGPLGTGFRQAIYTEASVDPHVEARTRDADWIPVAQGQRYIFSSYQKRSFDGQEVRVGAYFYDFDGNFISSLISGAIAEDDDWNRLNAGLTVPTGTGIYYMSPFVRFLTPDSIPANSRIGVANYLVEPVSDAAAVTGAWFDGDTEGFRWTGEPDNSATETATVIDAETIEGLLISGRNIPFEPTVLDFSPGSGSRFLWITPTDVYRRQVGATFDSSLTIHEMLVRKVARPGVRDFGTGDDMVPPTDGWGHSTSLGMAQEWFPDGPGISHAVTAVATVTSGGSIYTSGRGLYRRIFGLQAGRRYRLGIEYEFTVNKASSTNPPTDVEILNGAAAQVETFRDDDISTIYLALEFTATDNSATLSLRPQNDQVLTSGDSVRWDIYEYMVEEILETDTTPPAVGVSDRRTLYDVKASAGPYPSNIRKTSCGIMAEVTFGIHAGLPYYYRPPRLVGGLPVGTSQIVGESECTVDGQLIEINYAYNPSVETDLTGWTASGSGSSITRILAPGFTQQGDYFARATAPNSPGNRLDYVELLWQAPATGALPFNGQDLTITFAAATTLLEWNGVYDVQINIETASEVNSYDTTITLNENFWQIKWVHVSVPDGGGDIDSISVTIFTPGDITQGGGVEVDGWGIIPGFVTPGLNEQGDLVSIGWDDTTPGAEWTGTPQDSALRYVPPEVNEAVDPDCPPIPEPPAPPMIPAACVDEATSWERTVFGISGDEVPGVLTAFPVMTLTSGQNEVRQARIRFWPNPGDLAFDQLEPCAFEGDIVVSYMPPNSTLVIDGVRRTATLITPGGQEQVATHLLYSTGGGPAVWPEISGGIPHYVTLDTDTAGTFTDASLTVELVIRD